MLRITARRGLAAGMFRDRDIAVQEGVISSVNPKDPKMRAFLLKWTGTFVVILGDQAAELAAGGLKVGADGKLVDLTAPTKPTPATPKAKGDAPKA